MSYSVKLNPTDVGYAQGFWDALRTHKSFHSDIRNAQVPRSGSYVLPHKQAGSFTEQLKQENFLRTYGTVVSMLQNDYDVNTVVSDTDAQWVEEGAAIPDDDVILNNCRFRSHKLSSIAKIHVDLLEDKGFDFEGWLLKSFARRFGRAEVKAFLTGNGIKEPTGILAETGGAEVGVTAASPATVTYDEVLALFHALDSQYREKAMWVMNDETAIALRKIRDDAGNLLWTPGEEKLLGKKVIISNAMPNIASGSKPLAVGNFSYYWIMERIPFAVRSLTEVYVSQQFRGYIGCEHLDGKLILPEAVQVLQMTV